MVVKKKLINIIKQRKMFWKKKQGVSIKICQKKKNSKKEYSKNRYKKMGKKCKFIFTVKK